MIRALCTFVLVTCATSSASAQSLEWDPRWHRYGIGDVVAASTLGVASLVVAFTVDTEEPWWERVGPFDGGGDDPDDYDGSALRARRPSARRGAALASDPLALTLTLWPLVGETALTYGRHSGTAGQLAMVAVRSFAVTLALVTALKYGLRRRRPPGDESASRNRSFPSGHTAFAMTGAALVCTNQRQLPLYHTRAGGRAACGTAVGIASLVGILRIVAGKHHPSDVVVGAVIGLLAGFVLPRVVTYR